MSCGDNRDKTSESITKGSRRKSKKQEGKEMNAYTALSSNYRNIAEMTDRNPELATVMMKFIQGTYNYLIKRKVNPARIEIDSAVNEYGLVLTLRGKGSSTFVLDSFMKRNLSFEKIVRVLPDMQRIFTTLNNYFGKMKGISAILSRQGDQIIISGNKRGLYGN
jgi:hypothetical protein